MLITLIALLLSALFTGMGSREEMIPVQAIALGSSALFLLLTMMLLAQKNRSSISPSSFLLLPKDRLLLVAQVILFAIPLLLLCSLFLPHAFVIQLVLIGIGIDILRLFIKRLGEHLNPFKTLEFLVLDAKRCTQGDRDENLCKTIEAAGEIAQKALHQGSFSLANEAVSSLLKMSDLFLKSIKSFSHPEENVELQKDGVKDTQNYMILFFLQQFEGIFYQALEKRQSLAMSHIVTSVIKLAAQTVQADLSLVTLPLFYLNKMPLNAVQKGYSDVGVTATIGLIELAKQISAAKDLPFQEIKSPFITLIATLHELAKEAFKQDKSTKIALLEEPFLSLQKLCMDEPLKSHQDTPVILRQIELVLAEFDALALVLATKPPLPNLEELKGP